MRKVEDYTARAAASLAAAEGATSERDRMFHRRAHAVYRRLIVGEDQAALRAVEDAALKAKTAKPVKRAV